MDSPTLLPLASAHLRIARPTDQLDKLVAFYSGVLGFREVGRFTNHDGFDGVMLGHAGSGYHLEFTHAHGHAVGSAPSQDHLLVFYLPNHQDWLALVEHIEQAGVVPVPSFNPYWDRAGRTYEDPDGYRIVIQHGR